MDFARTMKEKARNLQKRVVLPEGSEERTIAAAVELVKQQYAREVTLLAARDEVVKNAKGADLAGINIIDPATSEWLPEFAEEYFRLRERKGLSREQAAKDIRHFLRFGAMMVRLGKADALVAGALSATADVLRAGLTVIGTAGGIKTASSCFIMDTHNEKWGVDGLMGFADCAVTPLPTAEQLADIAVASAATFKSLVGAEPVVAMLSFSTKGSGGDHENVLRVQEAVRLAKQKAPDLLLDGELQADAALIPAITEK
ncbi:MAG: phosphate acetyltransferase, partial [Candidatus Accumulibacter sp.]|nr:phosphate acetyltransferase [Accumulibacter sp.]